jgi:hypothetical protein
LFRRGSRGRGRLWIVSEWRGEGFGEYMPWRWWCGIMGVWRLDFVVVVKGVKVGWCNIWPDFDWVNDRIENMHDAKVMKRSELGWNGEWRHLGGGILLEVEFHSL